MILESIVTSIDESGASQHRPDGTTRSSATGPVTNVEDMAFVLRPFNSSRTYRNLIETRKAVVHVTDDAELFAKAAVGCDRIG